MTPFERVLSKFPDAKRRPDGQYMALCPCHPDNHPTLSIGEGAEGRVLLKCFAGCQFEDILRALGLTKADAKPTSEPFAPSEKWQMVPASMHQTSYDYTNAQGVVLYQAVRKQFTERNEATGKTRPAKTFFQQRKAAPGEVIKTGFLPGMKNVDYVLYRLPDVLQATSAGKPVYVVEGEKDADNMIALGLVATTNIGGADKWKPEYSQSLHGAHVVVLPDNDAAGKKHAERVATALNGIAKTVRVLLLPNLPLKGDVSDWIAAGGTADELKRLAKAAPVLAMPSAPVVETDATKIPPAAGRDPQGRSIYEPWQIVGLLRNLPGYTWTVEAPDTNAAHAARIALFLNEDLCFCSELGWLRWNGKHWSMDDKENTAAAAIVATLSRRVREEAAYLMGLTATLTRAGREADAAALLKASKDLLKHVRQVESYSFIDASLGLAADRLRVSWKAFTPKPWIFGFANGVWDKGEWREHRQTDYMMSVSPVVYDKNADRTEWLSVIDRMTGGDSELARTLQEFAGYCVSGASHLRLLPWVYGPRGTGKSTYAELLSTLLGDEAAAMEPDDFDTKSRERMGAKIWNKRLAVCGEAGEQRLDPATLKQISGGDTLPVRYLFKETFQAPARHVLLMAANDPPLMSAYDDALKSRVKVMPLTHDLSLPEPFKLTGGVRIEAVRQLPESPLVIGFASWVFDGLVAVHETQSVYIAPIVKTATESFWRDTDPLTGFWETIDTESINHGIAKADLRELYEKWCEKEGVRRPMQPRQWTKACEMHGLEEWRRNDADRTRCWRTGDAKPENVQNPDKTDKTDANSANLRKENVYTTRDFSEIPSVLSVLSVSLENSVSPKSDIPKGLNQVTMDYIVRNLNTPRSDSHIAYMNGLLHRVQASYAKTGLKIQLAYGEIAIIGEYGHIESFWLGPDSGIPVANVDPWEPAPRGLFGEPPGGWKRSDFPDLFPETLEETEARLVKVRDDYPDAPGEFAVVRNRIAYIVDGKIGVWHNADGTLERPKEGEKP